MNYCENCGSKVFSLGCVNCDEQNYIDKQILENELNPTTRVVREAMRIVSKDVRIPKCVRDGIVISIKK